MIPFSSVLTCKQVKEMEGQHYHQQSALIAYIHTDAAERVLMSHRLPAKFCRTAGQRA